MIPPTYRALGARAWDSLRGPTLWCRAGDWYVMAATNSGKRIHLSISIRLTRTAARLVLRTIAEEREAAAAERALEANGATP